MKTKHSRTEQNLLYAILLVTSFSINYNKTNKSRLNYITKYDF